VARAPSVALAVATPGPLPEGRTAELSCDASGYPSDFSFGWVVAGRPVPGAKGPRLRLENVSRELDGAEVTCWVASSAGRGEARIALGVRHGPHILHQPEGVVAR
jgi:hypothetical protein